MYTPQYLFGEVGSSSDILSHEPFLERARLQRELEQEGPARLALGAYVVARLIDKLLMSRNDGEDIESLRWQVEAVRRHIAELPSDSPETAHLNGIVSATSLDRPSSPALWKSLTAYAYYLEHEGRLEESLEILSLAVRLQEGKLGLDDFAEYALYAGRLNRLLARWDDATRCYAAAEEAAFKVGYSIAMLRGRLGQGAVHRGKGNLPAARLTAESVVRDAAELRLPYAQALAYADLGVVYSLQGLRLEALESHYRAFQLSPDPVQRMQTLGDLGLGLAEIGAHNAARLAFQIVGGSNAGVLVRANAVLEMMDLESSVGNRVAFERCRSTAEEYRRRMSPSMLADYRYKVGCGFARFGQRERARASLREALDVAERHRLNTWYFRIEQALAALENGREDSQQCQVSELSGDPAIREMEVGLREYALNLTT